VPGPPDDVSQTHIDDLADLEDRAALAAQPRHDQDKGGAIFSECD
jgi:hypothetical protein